MRVLTKCPYWIVPCFLIVFSLGQASAQPADQIEMETEVQRLIEAANAEPDPSIRVDLLHQIGEVVYDYKEAGGEAFDPAVIDGIAGLLEDEEDEEDGVRAVAAAELGLIGPAAARATRALITALLLAEYETSVEILERIKQSNPLTEIWGNPWDSDSSICRALHDIGTTPRDESCLDGYYKPHPH